MKTSKMSKMEELGMKKKDHLDSYLETLEKGTVGGLQGIVRESMLDDGIHQTEGYDKEGRYLTLTAARGGIMLGGMTFRCYQVNEAIGDLS